MLQLPQKSDIFNFHKYSIDEITKGLNLFEANVLNNLRIFFIWTLGFISWILSSYFWVVHADNLSLISMSISAFFCLFALYKKDDVYLRKVDQDSENKRKLSVYILLISISVLFMIVTMSFVNGIVFNIILLLLLHTWREFH